MQNINLVNSTYLCIKRSNYIVIKSEKWTKNSMSFLLINYVQKWVEAIPTHTNDVSVVVKFFHSHIFTRFGSPRALITDDGTHLCNILVDKVFQKYGVRHRTSLSYHL